MIKKGPPKRRSIRPQKRGVYTHCVHSLMLRGACLKLARCLPTCLHACPADPSARKTLIMTEITPRIGRSGSEVLKRCWERCLPPLGEVVASLLACMPSASFLFGLVFRSCFTLKNDQNATPKKAPTSFHTKRAQEIPTRAAER